jgi:hypothetical protein
LVETMSIPELARTISHRFSIDHQVLTCGTTVYP